jgi:hypothetical protein
VASDLEKRIRTDLDQARRARERERIVLLSTTLSEIRNRRIDQGADLDDDEVVEVVARAVKQRREAADQMREGGRPELAEKEEREAEALAAYLPEPLTEAQVRARVREIVEGGGDSLGQVMGRIMPELKGRFEGREAQRIVREELGA